MNKNLLWRIHNWVGLYAGVVIAFLSITGAAALFRPEIDRLLNPALTKVEQQPSEVSLTETVAKVLAMHPDKVLFEVELPREYVDTWNIRLRPAEPDPMQPMIWEVYVNPHSGAILGERNYFQSFSYFLRNIHVRFYEAAYGRQIVGLAGLALLVSTVTGLLIYGKFMKKQSFGQVRKKNLRITQADLHKYIGMATLAFNLMIAITGAWLGLQSLLLAGWDLHPPNTYTRTEKPFSPKEDAQFAVDFDKVSATAKKAFPELIPWLIRPTTNGEGLIHVFGDVNGQVYERRSNKLVLDKRDFTKEHDYNISDQNLGAKIYYVQEALHFGDFAGLPLKLLYCVLAFSSGFLSLSGFIIFLERTKKQPNALTHKIPLKRLLLRWSGGMLAFIIIMAVLSMEYSIAIPSLLVTTSVYGLLLLVLTKSVIGYCKRKFVSKKEENYEKVH